MTGANKGLGLELCRQLSAEGRRVFAVCRKSSPDLQKLQVEVLEGIELKDPEIAAIKVSEAIGRRRIELFINNAGVLIRDGPSAFSEMMVVNSLAPYVLAVKLLPNLIDHGALLIFVSSKMGSIQLTSPSGVIGYRMSKVKRND